MGCTFPSPEDLAEPGIEAGSPVLQVVFYVAGRFFTTEPPEKPPKWYESENVSFSVNPTLCLPPNGFYVSLLGGITMSGAADV